MVPEEMNIISLRQKKCGGTVIVVLSPLEDIQESQVSPSVIGVALREQNQSLLTLGVTFQTIRSRPLLDVTEFSTELNKGVTECIAAVYIIIELRLTEYIIIGNLSPACRARNILCGLCSMVGKCFVCFVRVLKGEGW